MIWYDMIWYDMIWYDMIWYDIIRWDLYDVLCNECHNYNFYLISISVPLGEYKTARTYLDRAKVLDPSFCDIGYQDAVIKVRRKVERKEKI